MERWEWRLVFVVEAVTRHAGPCLDAGPPAVAGPPWTTRLGRNRHAPAVTQAVAVVVAVVWRS